MKSLRIASLSIILIAGVTTQAWSQAAAGARTSSRTDAATDSSEAGAARATERHATKEGRGRGQSALLGALIGTGAGFGLGYALAQSDHDEFFTPSEVGGAFAVIGAGVGALIGFATGGGSDSNSARADVDADARYARALEDGRDAVRMAHARAEADTGVSLAMAFSGGGECPPPDPLCGPSIARRSAHPGHLHHWDRSWNGLPIAQPSRNGSRQDAAGGER